MTQLLMSVDAVTKLPPAATVAALTAAISASVEAVAAQTYSDFDGGGPTSTYGGTTVIDCGGI